MCYTSSKVITWSLRTDGQTDTAIAACSTSYTMHMVNVVVQSVVCCQDLTSTLVAASLAYPDSSEKESLVHCPYKLVLTPIGVGDKCLHGYRVHNMPL